MKIQEIELSDHEFELFQKIVFNEIGINLGNSKKFLVKNRLIKRLIENNIESFRDYYRFIQINKNEKTQMLNLLTTNETYFFRETSHFEFLEKEIVPQFKNKKIRTWSAASSVGAEAYSIAMLFDYAGLDYEIIGSDINTEVVKKATIGLYPLKWMDKIDIKYKKLYCLKGKGSHEGWFLVDRKLITQMRFLENNLLNPQNNLGMFDIVFLRNVLIYFDKETKKKIVHNVLKNLKVGGYLIISLTEHIHELEQYGIKKIHSSIFQKEKE